MKRLTWLGAVLALAGCDGGGDLSAEAAPVLETYANIVHASYEDSLSTAQALDGQLDALVANPTEGSLGDARTAWLAARSPYGQTEVYRFYGGPIEQGDPEREGALNAWPMDESVIDYVFDPVMGTVVSGGIVNDPSVTLDQASLEAANGVGGEENVTTGYHAIEFLLWGQDNPATSGPGERPATDFSEAENADRRGQYLQVTSDILLEDLGELVADWAPGSEDNYRAGFVSGDARDGLRAMLIGMGSLSGAELAGERMNVAFMTMDQEDEHSCFSDNTHNDILENARGIRNVYLGRYARVDGSMVEGASLSDLVAARDPDLDATMRAQLDASLAAAEAIPAPFDEAITGAGRDQVQAAIDALRAQTTTIVEIGALFELELNLEE